MVSEMDIDVQWLGLEEGKDFGGLMDLAGLWRTFNPKFKNYSYVILHYHSFNIREHIVSI
jgi:phage terminase large subunit-like protein